MPTETSTLPAPPEATVTPTETVLPAGALLPPTSEGSNGPLPTPSQNGPAADYLTLIAATLTTSATTLGWLWFLVGSIIFFGVAGMFAGLGFRQRENRRYRIVDEALVDADWGQFDGEQFDGQFEEEFPPVDDPFAAQSFANDRFAASSPFNRPAPSNERQKSGTALGAAQDGVDDDFWPASLP